MELKPCPFCGGLARFNIWEQGEPGYKTSGWVVECPDCLCSTGIYSKSGAIEAWNRRTGETSETD